MTLSMKQFRMHAFDLESGNDDDDMDESDPEGESPAAIKKRHKRELERSERENRENTSALLELRDLEDELTTLQKLFDIQETTIHQMKDIYTSSEFKDITKNGQDYLDEALEYVEEYKQQTTEMLKRVDTTRNDVRWIPKSPNPEARTDIPVCSMRRCWRWCNARPRWTKCAGLACKPSWHRARTSRP